MGKRKTFLSAKGDEGSMKLTVWYICQFEKREILSGLSQNAFHLHSSPRNDLPSEQRTTLTLHSHFFFPRFPFHPLSLSLSLDSQTLQKLKTHEPRTLNPRFFNQTHDYGSTHFQITLSLSPSRPFSCLLYLSCFNGFVSSSSFLLRFVLTLILT